jgi:3-oxoacyl-[acyl-carrier protein] reductase
MSRLSNKVAIVTGASKGIGSGIATAMAAAGARVAVNYSGDREGAERVAQAIINSGGEAIAVGADVSKATDVARLFKEVDSAFGRLDVLVNNAGVFRFGSFADITEDSFHLHYNINVLGSILTVQEAIKRFGPEGGSVINLSSIVGSHPVAGALLYASTKGAIETLTKGLALELAPRKIRVNAIAPGHTETMATSARGPLRVAPEPFWRGRHRLAGSVASLTLRRWQCSWRLTNQAGSPERLFVQQVASLWRPERTSGSAMPRGQSQITCARVRSEKTSHSNLGWHFHGCDRFAGLVDQRGKEENLLAMEPSIV